MLCVPATKVFDPATRDGISVFQTANGSPTGTVSSVNDHTDLANSNHGHACPASARNAFEFLHFFSSTGAEIPESVKELQGFLGVKDTEQSGTLDEATRRMIAKARAGMTGLNDVIKDDKSNEWVTPKLFDALQKKAAQPNESQSQ